MHLFIDVALQMEIRTKYPCPRFAGEFADIAAILLM